MISIPKRRGGIWHRPVLREDAKCTWRTAINMAGEWPGAEASLPARRRNQPRQHCNFQTSPPELWDDTLLLLKSISFIILCYSSPNNHHTPRGNTSSDFRDHLEFLHSSKGPVVLLYFDRINYRRLSNLSAHFFPALPERTLSECSS